MSVLITGMKMPKNCDECCFAYRGACIANIGREVKVDQICQLVEVPAPHGRLLDADDVYHVLTSYYHHSTDFQHETLKEALARVSTIIGEEDGE